MFHFLAMLTNSADQLSAATADADMGRLAELGHHFQNSASEPSIQLFTISWPAIAFLAGMTVAICGAVVFFQYHKSFYPPFANDEEGLLHNLAYNHRLDRRDISLLRRVAKQKDITPVAKIFLQPEALQNAISSCGLPADKQEMLERIHTRISGAGPASA